MTENIKALVISYVPLMAEPDPEHRYFENEDAKKILPMLEGIDETNNGADGVGWTTDLYPVFIMKHAGLIAKHIEFWSENKPKEWFTLQWICTKNEYALAIMPNFEMSVERYKANHTIIKGEELPDNMEFEVMTKPIYFTSGDASTFNKMVRDNFPSEVQIGFISEGEDEPYWLGDGVKFKTKNVDNPYMQNLLERDK